MIFVGAGDRPLDGVEQVPWDELLTDSEDESACGAEVIRALTSIAAGDDVYGNCERIADMITPDVDFHYSEWGQDFGYGRAAPAVVGFLARIAASRPDDDPEQPLERPEGAVEAGGGDGGRARQQS